jgi:two-component system, OmpR family, sensor histidine kinase SenX3
VNWFGRGEIERLRRELALEVSARRVAEEHAAQLNSGLDAVPAGLVLADSDGTILLRNGAASLGGHADVLLEEALEQALAVAASGDMAEQKLTLFGPPQRVLLVRGIPLPGGGALAVIDDLTDMVRVDAVRTDFVSNISHELKTPVGALAVLAEALVDSDDLDINRHLATKMIEEAHRASGTIDDLLELSRIELDGRGTREDVNLSAVIGEAVGRHRLRAETLGVHLCVGKIAPDSLEADGLQLVSAVSNLVDNAVKYSDHGGTVRIDSVVAEPWAEIHVSDDGIGIPARDLDRIFERFYRVDRARSRETGGTGLGLAIVRHVATNHGGEVSVVSREGEGSTFSLRIPLAVEIDLHRTERS